MSISFSFHLIPEKLKTKFGHARINDSKLFLPVNLKCNDTPTLHVDVHLGPMEQVHRRRCPAGRQTRRDEGAPWR